MHRITDMDYPKKYYKDGRILIFSLLIIYTLIFLFIDNYTNFTRASGLFLSVNAMTPHFADLRVIQGAYHSFLAGLNPYLQNPYDPWHRTYNYPPIWIYMLGEHLTPQAVLIFGWILIVGFIITIFKFLGRLTLTDGAILSIIVVSPANFLLLERGNTDIIIFILLALYILSFSYLSKLPKGSYLLGMGVAFISILKFYPIFSLAALTEKKQSYFRLLSVSILIFAAYLIVIANYLSLIAENTPHTSTLANYGCGNLPILFAQLLENLNITNRLQNVNPYIIGIVCYTVVVLLSAIVAIRKPKARIFETTKDLVAFRVGAGIYIGTFALGHNWDYRLVFLIFTLPQLLAWGKQNIFSYKLIVSVIFSVAVLMNWKLVSTEFVISAHFLNELISWYLLSALTYMYVSCLPEWARFKQVEVK